MTAIGASRDTLGIIGTIVGLVALGIAVFHFFLGPIEPPRSFRTVVAEVASDVKDALAAKLEGREYAQEPELGPDRMVDALVIVIGFIALALGVVGLTTRERWRPNGTAIALGSAAIAFQLAIALVAAVVVAIILVHILDYLDVL